MANDGKDGPSDLVREAMEREGVGTDNVVPIKGKKNKRKGQPQKKANGLTPKMEKFIRVVLEGNTASDAYRAAYNVENMKITSIHDAASKLFLHPAVSQRIATGLARKEEAATHSGASLRAMLVEKLVDVIKDPDSQATLIRAVHELGSVGTVNLFAADDAPRDDIDPDELLAELQTKLKAAFPATG